MFHYFYRMKQIRIYPVIVLLFSLLFLSVDAQMLQQYRNGKAWRVYSAGIKDSLKLEVFIPREAEFAPDRSFPVIFLFDSQNSINYRYNLQTIDYLTSLANMPAAVLVGVEFPGGVRNKWTVPVTQNGMADSLLGFLFGPVRSKLTSFCKLSAFNILVGHSRTAMLSSYSLAAFPEKVNAVIAASNSFFDFNNEKQQLLFETHIRNIRDGKGSPQFFYFSSGSLENGDAHDTSVAKLNSYMKAQQFPAHFHWKYYREKTPHISVPGITTGRALNDLFSPVTEALQRSFSVVNNQYQSDSVPWSAYQSIYKDASDNLGFTVEPDITFYNSLASAYLNDYNDRFKESRYKLATNVLERAIIAFPAYPGFYSFLSSVNLEAGNKSAARKFLQQAGLKLKMLRFANQDQLNEEKAAIKELAELLK